MRYVSLLMLFLFTACGGAPKLNVGADPSDPTATVPHFPYVGLVAPSFDSTPVQPKPWTDQNRMVAPRGSNIQ